MSVKLNILHLEDDQNDAQLIWASLAEEGFDCSITHVDTKEDFIARLADKKFDLILSDYKLPAFDGFSALELVRNSKLDMPFILCSGTIGEEQAVEALKNGATDYVLKDHLSRLGPSINRALKEVEERRVRLTAQEEVHQHLEELQTIYKLSDSAIRLKTLEEYYHVTLDAVLSRQKTARGSLLVFDNDGMVFFETHKGFSEVFFHVIEEYNPWKKSSFDTYPEPILISDIIKDGASLGKFRDQILNEGIRAVGFIPLVHNRRLIGNFALWYDQPHDFLDKELRLLLTVAGQVSLTTERKKAEMELKNRESQLTEAQTIAGIGSWELDLINHTSTWSDEMFRLLGLTPREVPLGYEMFISFVHPEDQSIVAEAITRLSQTENSLVFDFRIIRKDGAVREIHSRKKSLKDESGKVLKIFATNQDVTEHRQAERDLDQSLGILLATFESTSDGILVVTQEGKILTYNRRFMEMFHVAEEIMKNETDQALMTLLGQQASNQSEFAHQIERLHEASEAENYDIFQLRDGRTIECISMPHKVGGKSIGRVVSFRDLSERLNAEEKIREQAELLDKAQDAIIVREMDHHIRFWNKAAERILGWTSEEAIGQNVLHFLINKEHQQSFLVAYNSVIKDGEWMGELHYVNKNGADIIVQSRWTLVRNEEGIPRSILVIDTDITEKKSLESQFLRAQRMESIGTLAGGIAHDLNNVLSPILLSTEIMLRMKNDDRVKKMLETIHTSAKRGADMVKQVLGFARGIEGEKLTIQPKHLLDEMIKIVKETFPKSIRFSFDIPKGLWTLMGDPTQLHQVLMNLCVNARDAMPSGGVLSISAENMVIDEGYARMNLEAKAGAYILLKVADTGAGIPPGILDKIFDPFFTTKEIGKGTGLGLSTVLSIIRSHGGFITVYSEMNRGTTFNVYIPSLQSTVEDEKLHKEFLPMGNGETILVIEDEVSLREITREILIAHGYVPLLASDGTEGISVYIQHQQAIRAVITDMMMPYMDGAATIRALRKVNPEVLIIACSGAAESSNAIMSSGEGAQVFLQKPYTAEKLLNTLNDLLVKGKVSQSLTEV